MNTRYFSTWWGFPLLLRKLLVVFVITLPLLLVAFAAVMGFYAIVQVGKDSAGSSVLWWVGVCILLLIVVDLVALVGVLGLRALVDSDLN